MMKIDQVNGMDEWQRKENERYAICDQCRQWCATTQEQLTIRRVNMIHDPNVTVHPCPSCGGTKWATTDEMVFKPTKRWWEFWR